MDLLVDSLKPADVYKLLTNIVVPRPIAWVTSRNTNGSINLAPFSFFNAIGSNPPVVVISIGMNELGQPKDTARNIESTGQFVVNLVTEDLINAMNISAADFPAGESELAAAGLHEQPSKTIDVPRIAEAKAAMECKLHSIQRIGVNNIILGEILAIYIDDVFVTDRAKYHIENFAPIGRLGSPSMYSRTTDRFDLKRLTYRDVSGG